MGGGVGENASSEHRWWNRSEVMKSENWLSKSSTIVCVANEFHVGKSLITRINCPDILKHDILAGLIPGQ